MSGRGPPSGRQHVGIDARCRAAGTDDDRVDPDPRSSYMRAVILDEAVGPRPRHHPATGADGLAASADRHAADAEEAQAARFPEKLKQCWLLSNGLELPSGWKLLPVFDRSHPRKTADHIVREGLIRDCGLSTAVELGEQLIQMTLLTSPTLDLGLVIPDWDEMPPMRRASVIASCSVPDRFRLQARGVSPSAAVDA